MSVGFDVIYPGGCKEIHEGIKVDELKRRLVDLTKSLENMSEICFKDQDSLLNATQMDTKINMEQAQSISMDLRGLFLHLSNEQFIDHHDSEVQLRVAVCMCYIIKIACPTNPFACYTDSETITKSVLHFLLKCIKEFSRMKSKSDKLFMPVYTVLSICCEIDIFHFFSTVNEGNILLSECFHTFFDIVKHSNDWCENSHIPKMITDAMVNLLSSPEVHVPETLVTYLLNILVDKCSSKMQKHISLEIFTKCANKLEEKIQTVLQHLLIKTDKEEDLSESSDNEEVNNDDDDFCSLDSYKLKLKKSEKIKSKQSKMELVKGTLESNIEYACHHVFQMIFEMFKINEDIVTSLLPTIEMKLRSTQVTERKRACRLIGKLFASSRSNNNQNQSSLWETFLGRLSDIELEVREICVKIARDLLKNSLLTPENCGIMILDKEKEELIKAFQKRSNDQDEPIRYLIVIAVSQILEHSKTIIQEEELDVISEAMFKLLLHQSRDKALSVRKEAHSTMGKLYRKIIEDIEMKSKDKGDIDLSLGLRNLHPGQKSRVELLLNLILRQYVSTDVEDRIVVERLFNTSLVPYGQDSSTRMRSLLQCLTLTDDPSVLCIHEMFKTQISVMNLLRQTMSLVGDASSDRIMSPSLSQKLREKVKKLSEYLSSKDKVDSLTKLFNQARSDKRLNELLHKFVNKSSSRQVIVKTIMDIKKHFPSSTSKAITAVDLTSAASLKKKTFIGTIKCILERGAPIIFDSECVQELLSHCVAIKEATEYCTVQDHNLVPLSRTLRLLHTLLLMSKKLVPIHEAFEYLVSIMTSVCESDFINGEGDLISEDSKKVSKSQTNCEEELCLLVLSKMVECMHSVTGTEKDTVVQDIAKENTLFSYCSDEVLGHTRKVLRYLERRCLSGSSYKVLPGASDNISRNTKKERRGYHHQDNANDHREICQWKYDCKVAKLASNCFVGLLRCCNFEIDQSQDQDNSRLTSLRHEINLVLTNIVDKCCQCESFTFNQPVMITSLMYITVTLSEQYELNIRNYATDVVPKLLGDDINDRGVTQSKNLTLWMPEVEVSKVTQVRIQALKLLSRWVVTLKADDVSDQKCIVYVMSSLRKYIGNYGMEEYAGDVSDKEMSHLRLAAGKCWLRIAQMQSFLPIFDVKWIYKLASLVFDPCPQVRDEFLRKLHLGLCKLKLPLEYMAMFAFVPKVKNQDYLNIAKKYLQTNVTRRREFLDTYPEYLNDAKKLFGILPEYVLCFVIHMMAHDPDWKDKNLDESLVQIKQSLWFIMEPILKLNENYSFIRKLLERIKHAQDAADPNNTEINEKLYICSDIALGILITKQSSYDLKEYPVELKLPRTRYISAPNTFFNPDFANILLENNTRARIQFSPTPKSKQMIKNCMPIILIKGNHSTSMEVGPDGQDIVIEHNQHIKPSVSKSKKHVAKIVVGLPELESECVTEPFLKSNKRQGNARKHKVSRSKSPTIDLDDVSPNQISVSKRGRVCKPNFLVMKDMVSPTKKSSNVSVVESSTKDTEVGTSSVRIEGTVSINLERLMSDVIRETLNVPESSKKNNVVKSKVLQNKNVKDNTVTPPKSKKGSKLSSPKILAHSLIQKRTIKENSKTEKFIQEKKRSSRKSITVKSQKETEKSVRDVTQKESQKEKERKNNDVNMKNDLQTPKKVRLSRASLHQSQLSLTNVTQSMDSPVLPSSKGMTRVSRKSATEANNMIFKSTQRKNSFLNEVDRAKDQIPRSGGNIRNTSKVTPVAKERTFSSTDSPRRRCSPDKVTFSPISSPLKGRPSQADKNTSEDTHGTSITRRKSNIIPSLSPKKNEKSSSSSKSSQHIIRHTRNSASTKKDSSQEREVTVSLITRNNNKGNETREKTQIDAKSPLKNGIPTKEVVNRRNIRNVSKTAEERKSPTELINRSKRVASQAATVELAKKVKRVS